LSFTMLKLAAFILLLFAISQTNAGIIDTALPDLEDENISSAVEGLITDLDQNSFNKTVHCSKDFDHCTAYFVMFYNSNSEVSRDFSLKYVTMAVPTMLWSSVVKLGAVDCAESTNKKLCVAYGFKRMPLFKYFERKSIAGNIGATVPSYVNGIAILEGLAKQINREYQAHPYPDWPNFNPLPEFRLSSDEVWQYANGYNEIMLIFVEDATEPAGISMFIESSKAANGLPVRRVLKGHHLDRISKNTEYPSGSIMKRRVAHEWNDCRTDPII